MVLNFQSLTEKAYIIAHSDSTASPKSKNAKIRRLKKERWGKKYTADEYADKRKERGKEQCCPSVRMKILFVN